jgi:hypothetical protein
MKRLLTLAILILIGSSYLSAQVVTERCWHLDKVQFLQHKQDFWRSHKLFSTTAQPVNVIGGGMYNITEGHYGFGLSEIDPPYSNHFAGVTTAFGWRFGGGLAAGGGTGFLKYNGGYTIPLYADLRYFMGKQRNKFFIAIPGGFLLNFDNFKDYSRVFVNPSAGIIVPVTKNTHLSFSAGLFTQIDRDVFADRDTSPYWRDSFLNMKLGLLFGW